MSQKSDVLGPLPRITHGLRAKFLVWLSLSLTLTSLLACGSRVPLATLTSGQTGRIPFQTVTLQPAQVFAGVTDGPPAVVWGTLRLSPSTQQRLPAVMVVHGSSGVGAIHQRWAQRLRRAGFATFLLDSFTGRRISKTVEDQQQLWSWAMIVDAYRALALLATHPRLDPSRIAIMGFSKGGVVSLYAGLKQFQQVYGSPDVVFAAHVAFYPFCNYDLKMDSQVTDRPIRIFHGEADDWTPIATCRRQVERWRELGKDVQLTAYPGVWHSFDRDTLPSERYLPQVQNPSRCVLVEGREGRLLNQATGRPFRWQDACVTTGATVGYDARADRDAQKTVMQFLTCTLKGCDNHWNEKLR